MKLLKNGLEIPLSSKEELFNEIFPMQSKQGADKGTDIRSCMGQYRRG
jgi:hypothetical protein